MKQAIRLFIAITFLGFCLYSYVDRLNALTELKLQIPVLAKELQILEEDNRKLEYAIGTFENPMHLMALARQPEFSHLKHPFQNTISSFPEGLALQVDPYKIEMELREARGEYIYNFEFPIALGAAK